MFRGRNVPEEMELGPRLVKLIYDKKGHLITVIPLSAYSNIEEEEDTKHVTIQPIVVQRPSPPAPVVERENVEIFTLPVEIERRMDSLSNKQGDLDIKVDSLYSKEDEVTARMNTFSNKEEELGSKIDTVSTKYGELNLKINAIAQNQEDLMEKTIPLYSKINSFSSNQEELFAKFNSLSSRYETLVKELIEKTKRPARIIRKVVVRRPRVIKKIFIRRPRVIRKVVIKRIRKEEKGPSRARIIRLFKNKLKLRSFKKVLIVSDKTNVGFGAVLFDVARKINRKTVMMVMETRTKARQEPEEAVRRAMERADLILVATKYSVKRTGTVRRLLAQGKNLVGIQKSLKVTPFKR